VDKFGAKVVMFWGLVTWSVASIGGGLSTTIRQFGFFRAVLGIGEPANFPTQLRVVTIWFTGKMRATANSLCVAGSSFGAIIAPPLVAWLAISYTWDAAFLFIGIIGFIIALLWLVVYRDPPERIAKEAADSSGMSRTVSFSWGELWKTRSLWAVLLIRFVSDPVWYFCLFWLPGYLQQHSGLSLAQIGLFGWIPFLAADLGGIGTSAWSDRMVRKGKKPLRSRKIMLTTAAVAAPLCALTPYLPNAWTTILVFCFIAAMCISWLFSISVVVSEVFPVNNVASVLGIAGGCGAAGAVLFNFFIGHFLGTLGAGKIFFAMAFLHPLAVLILWTMVRPEKLPQRV
jgi:ACS family hexuronate transporter-like MFS transporter